MNLCMKRLRNGSNCFPPFSETCAGNAATDLFLTAPHPSPPFVPIKQCRISRHPYTTCLFCTLSLPRDHVVQPHPLASRQRTRVDYPPPARRGDHIPVDRVLVRERILVSPPYPSDPPPSETFTPIRQPCSMLRHAWGKNADDSLVMGSHTPFRHTTIPRGEPEL